MITCKRQRGKKFPGVQPFPYTDQKSVSYQTISIIKLSECVSVYVWHRCLEPLKLARRRKWGVAWKDQILRLLQTPKISTGTTRGSDVQGGGAGVGDKHSSLQVRDGIKLYSHQWTTSHGLFKSLIYSRINIFIRSISTSPLNYILTLDRSVEASYESRQITHRSPIRFFSFH